MPILDELREARLREELRRATQPTYKTQIIRRPMTESERAKGMETEHVYTNVNLRKPPAVDLTTPEGTRKAVTMVRKAGGEPGDYDLPSETDLRRRQENYRRKYADEIMRARKVLQGLGTEYDETQDHVANLNRAISQHGTDVVNQAWTTAEQAAKRPDKESTQYEAYLKAYENAMETFPDNEADAERTAEAAARTAGEAWDRYYGKITGGKAGIVDSDAERTPTEALEDIGAVATAPLNDYFNQFQGSDRATWETAIQKSLGSGWSMGEIRAALKELGY